MKVVGLTGGIGSGKSTVAALLQARGAAVVDTDEISRHLTGPAGAAMEAVREAFGARFVTAEGALDRALAARRPAVVEVITDPEIRAKAGWLPAQP